MAFERNYDKDELEVKVDGKVFHYGYAGNCLDCETRLFMCLEEEGDAHEKIPEHVAVVVAQNVLYCGACYPNNVKEVRTAFVGENAFYWRVGQCFVCKDDVWQCATHPLRNDEAVGRYLAVHDAGGHLFCQMHDPGLEQRAKGGLAMPVDSWTKERYA